MSDLSDTNATATSIPPTTPPAAVTVSMTERYVAAMVLSGVGDAMGYNDGDWEFCRSGSQIHRELEEKFGGLDKLVISLPDWIVSDDTVMHIATAEALDEEKQTENFETLYHRLALKYKLCMNDMDDRAPGSTCMSSASRLRPNKPDGYKIKFNTRHGGCGAAMRAMCIGLRYPRPEDLDSLIAVSIESGRMTHNCPLGYLGALTTALFTHYAIQGKDLKSWGAELMEVLKRASEYIVKTERDVELNETTWSEFVTPWIAFLDERGIDKGRSNPVFPAGFDNVDFRDKYYKKFAAGKSRPGSCGHDAPLIAYDSLLAAGDSWSELCLRGVLHGGDNDSTGAIAGAWFGAVYGFKGVPGGHHEHLEYRSRLERLGKRLLELSSSHRDSDVVVC